MDGWRFVTVDRRWHGKKSSSVRNQPSSQQSRWLPCVPPVGPEPIIHGVNRFWERASIPQSELHHASLRTPPPLRPKRSAFGSAGLRSGRVLSEKSAHQKGDISNELSMGTFLTRFDTARTCCLTAFA